MAEKWKKNSLKENTKKNVSQINIARVDLIWNKSIKSEQLSKFTYIFMARCLFILTKPVWFIHAMKPILVSIKGNFLSRTTKSYPNYLKIQNKIHMLERIQTDRWSAVIGTSNYVGKCKIDATTRM